MSAPARPAAPVPGAAPHHGPVRVPFSDVCAQFAQIRPEVVDALTEVADSGGYVLGPKVAAFVHRPQAVADARLPATKAISQPGAEPFV